MDMGNSLKIGSGTNSQLAPSSLLSLLASQLTKHTTSSWYSLDYLGIFSRDKLLKSINRYKRNELLHFLVCKKKHDVYFPSLLLQPNSQKKRGQRIDIKWKENRNPSKTFYTMRVFRTPNLGCRNKCLFLCTFMTRDRFVLLTPKRVVQSITEWVEILPSKKNDESEHGERRRRRRKA